jgi:hypothetical protein
MKPLVGFPGTGMRCLSAAVLTNIGSPTAETKKKKKLNSMA